ncbi:MAG TPA: 1-phosphofructokinase family hexose kinase [Rhizomicrobium sp.]|nr:1-phosphofructokinase family hexose kinase [Rhizomicrobium sp.]
MTAAARKRIVTLTLNPALDIAANVEKLVPDRKLRCENVRKDPGGGGINVARVAHRLGGEVTAVFPSGGIAGEIVCECLRKEQVPFRAIPVAGDTRENFNVIDRQAGKQYRFIFPGSALAEVDWQACLDGALALIGPGDYLVGSGSLPPGVPEDFYARMSRAAEALGALVAVDTSGPALKGLGSQRVHLLKASRSEMSELAAQPLPDLAAWRRTCENLVSLRKADIVALSLGPDGALLATSAGVWRAAAPAMASANAVGAGDSFLGSLVSTLAGGTAPADALPVAVAAGSAAMLAAGTGLCERAHVTRLAKDVVVERLR